MRSPRDSTRALASLREILLGLKRRGRAILITTHILEIAEALADRIYIIRSGEIVWSGRTEDIRRDTRTKLEDFFFELVGGPKYEEIARFLREVR